MEIEVGEYVRTDNGKIIKADDKEWIELLLAGHSVFGRAYKHSSNIIDLIEVGDYVNGKEVKHIAIFEGFPNYKKVIFVNKNRLIPGETAENKEIKSIVTKEQFKNAEYTIIPEQN